MNEADGGYGRFGDDVADRDPAREDAAGDESQVVDLSDDVAHAPAPDAADLEGPLGGALDDGTDHDVPDAPRTGDAGVDEAVDALRAAVGGPLDGQVAAYDAVHRALQDRLADVEG